MLNLHRGNTVTISHMMEIWPVGLSTVSVSMGIQAPYPSHLALKEQFDGTVDGLVTPHIRLSSDSCIQVV